MSDPSTVIVCPQCKAANFWLQRFTKSGDLHLRCQGCGETLTTIKTEVRR